MKEVHIYTMYPSGILFVAFMAFLSGIPAEVVDFTSCDEVTACKIHEVRVDPCKEAAEKEACKIKRGKSASISFDFTPEFEGTELSNRVYWENGFMDIPFVGMDTDGCHFTQCPITKSHNQTFTYELNVNRKFPVRSFPLKWKVWNKDEALCCFRFDIKLTK